MNTPDLAFYNTKRYKLTVCIAMAVFFYLFLIFFLPFGVSNFNPNHEYTAEFLWEIFKFFLVTIAFALGNEFLIKQYFIKSVSTKSIVLWSAWTLVLLGMVNFMTYNVVGDWHDFHFKSAVGFVFNCSTVFIFPMIATLFYFRYQSLQESVEHFRNGNIASIDAEKMITFAGEGSKDKIIVSASSFLYVRAQDNYVAIHYLKHEKVAKQLIRTSLSKLTDSIDHPALIRCHRSYMVNLIHVNAIKGGKKDTVLYFGPIDISIPVSKSYRDQIFDKLHMLKNIA